MNLPFSTQSPGIAGRIKRRYSDFVVEEITKEHECKVEHFAEPPQTKEIVWPENTEGKENLILEMEKFNTDFYMAVKTVSRFLRFSQKRIGYAGIKDKRGITSQLISIFKPELGRAKEFRSRNIFLKPVKWQNERIDLGDLEKNRFRIVVREIELGKEETEKRILESFKEIQEKGIANFFGEQRFGGIREVTHLVGKEVTKGSMEKAVMLYLTHPAEKEDEDIANARKNLEKTKDFAEATKEFPIQYRFERAIIHHLCKFPKDFVGAFANLPKKLRYMFTHAYQSYLFNEIIKERLAQNIGLKPTDGDELLDGIPTAPLIGFETILSSGKIKKIEEKILKKEGTKIEDFKVKQMPELSSKGARKKILLEPENLQLIEVAEDEINPGKIKAVLSFTLTKGNYATTVMREIMKVDDA
ncbi:MAG: tRNA pseudouridine(13) synthase TruD [Candidatus Diapherotrites archaeon]|nr:tRNA pseudouridine(13) synthase TruD [Candidatus Diapherotrites archaeon]